MPKMNSGPRAACISRIQPADLAAILTAAGYRSQVQSDKSGQYVATTMSGYSVLVFPYDCKAQGCSSIQFWTGFSADPGPRPRIRQCLEHPVALRQGQYRRQGNFIFTSDVFLDGGVSAENIKVERGPVRLPARRAEPVQSVGRSPRPGIRTAGSASAAPALGPGPRSLARMAGNIWQSNCQGCPCYFLSSDIDCNFSKFSCLGLPEMRY